MGSQPQSAPISLRDITMNSAQLNTSTYYTPSDPSKGFLDSIETRYYVETASGEPQFQKVPYYQEISADSTGVSESLANTISDAVTKIANNKYFLAIT